MTIKRINRWYAALGVVLVIGLGIFFTGMWFNGAKYCYGGAACTYFKHLDWESLCAGLFGLAGGLAVIAISREQLRKADELRLAELLHDATELRFHLTPAVEKAEKLYKKLKDMGELGEGPHGAIYGYRPIIKGNGHQMAESAQAAMAEIKKYDSGAISDFCKKPAPLLPALTRTTLPILAAHINSVTHESTYSDNKRINSLHYEGGLNKIKQIADYGRTILADLDTYCAKKRASLGL